MRWAWTAIACLQLLLCAKSASAQGDPASIDPTGAEWNDLGDLVTLSERLGFAARTPERLELWKLPPEDAVIIVHPTVTPSSTEVNRFIRSGGRVALLDDFGRGHGILREIGIGRHAAAAAPEDRRLRGNPDVSIATPAWPHELTTGVEALVVNHAQTLYHSKLQTVFALDDDGSAVVLVGKLDNGRLVAVSDSSILINNMLRFRGNRRFAENLVRYLVGDRGGQLWLVAGDTPIVGKGGRDAPQQLVAAMRERLAKLANLELPPRLVWLFSWALLTVFILFAAGSLPRRAGGHRAGIEEAPVLAGYDGRVGFFSAPRRNLFGALLAYKFEFETELIRRLGLPKRPSRQEVVAGLRKHADAGTAARAEALLQALDTHALQKDRAPAPPRIHAAAFGTMVEDGRRILDAVHSPPKPGHKHG